MEKKINKKIVAVFKNQEQDSEYNAVRRNGSGELRASFLQNKCIFDDCRVLCMKQQHAGALQDDFQILEEKEKCNRVEVQQLRTIVN